MKKTLLFAVLAIGCAGYANVKVPAIFSDHAILQTSPATAVFGKADPGEKVAVSYGSAKAETVAGKDGKWLVKLDLSKDDGKGKDLIISNHRTPPAPPLPLAGSDTVPRLSTASGSARWKRVGSRSHAATPPTPWPSLGPLPS